MEKTAPKPLTSFQYSLRSGAHHVSARQQSVCDYVAYEYHFYSILQEVCV